MKYGHLKIVILEKLQLRFCKYILSVNKCTYNNMVYGKLGVLPLKVHVKCRAICFWARLITDQKCKLSSLIYKLFYCMLELNIYESKWILYIKNSLIDCGFPGVWNAQHIPNSFECFKEVIKRRLEDQFIQKWSEELFNSGKCTNYKIFKTNLILEKYLLLTAPNIRKSITRFRCRNSKLPIVLGSVVFHVIDVPAPYVTTDSSVMNVIIFSKVGTLKETEKIY